MFEDAIIKARKLVVAGVEASIPVINSAAQYVANATATPAQSQNRVDPISLSNKKAYTMTDTTLNLVKGGTLNLTKATGGLTEFLLNLSWTGGADLDVSAFVLNDAGKRVDICYYNNLTAPGLKHSGDLRDGGEEEITIDTNALTAGRVVVAMTSHNASATDETKRGNPILFGAAATPVAKLINPKNGQVLVQCNLGEDATLSTAMEFVEIYKREDGAYIFKNLSNPLGTDAFGLAEMDKKYPA